jgi:hypothetical protein
MLIHTCLFVLLGLMLRPEPRGAASEPVRDVGVVLAKVDNAGEQFFESPALEAAQAQAAPQQATPQPLVDAATDRPPLELSDVLPKQRDTVGAGALPQTSPAATNLPAPGARGNNVPRGALARTKVYGIVGQGQRFVYVFDRSASMGADGNVALRSAQHELLSSLKSLGPEHSFQIIFYNEKPTIFPLAGVQGKLVFATDANKQSAERFVRSMIADGGTNHYDALMLALGLDADVIFFLTDADLPGLNAVQMQRIVRRNQHASINCIEFGAGPKRSVDNFLQVLARNTGGQYVYIDSIQQLPKQ